MNCMSSIVLRGRCCKCQKFLLWCWKPSQAFFQSHLVNLFTRNVSGSSGGTWNHYQTLGIEQNAKPEEIKAAYLKLSKQHHPDKSSEKTSDEFLKISNAYENLASPKRRIEYDMQEFARSSNINRFASGEYELYNSAGKSKTKVRHSARSGTSKEDLEKKEQGKLFSVSPRLRRLLSYLYFAIILTGTLMYYLANKFGTGSKNDGKRS